MSQPSGDNRLPNPPCGEGAPIGVRTEQFRIDSHCIAPLVLPSPTPISVSSGKSVSITWVPPENSSVSRISIQLDLAHHGGKKGELDCDAPDTGSFELPKPLVSKVVSLGLGGFPTVIVSLFRGLPAPRAR